MTLLGVEARAVVELIAARQEARRSGRRPADDRKLGMVIEGGGMRGVYSAGSLLALDILGFRDVFDEVYATSAGSINAAYFLSGQGKMGITIYFQDINNSRFINPLRFYKIVDVDYAFDHVISKVKPLDTKAIVEGEPRLFISLIDRRSAEGFSVAVDCVSSPVVDVLKASSALPVIYNRAIEVEGRLCVDGGMISAIPLFEAVARGCTDILVLLTRPPEHRSPYPDWIQRFFFDLLCARGNEKLGRVFRQAHQRYDERRDFAFGRERFPRPVRIATICPDSGDTSVARTTIETRLLVDAAERLGSKTYEIFERDPVDFRAQLRQLTEGG